MKWTSRKPREVGWYWLAAPTGYTPRIVKVWEEQGKFYVNAESPGWPLWKSWKGCRWYGPLKAPEGTYKCR